MPTPSQNQDARLLEGRLESQERQLDNLSHRMDKYDEIIDDLRVIVIALKARSDTDEKWAAAHQKWIITMLTIGTTVFGGGFGSIVTYILTHWHP